MENVDIWIKPFRKKATFDYPLDLGKVLNLAKKKSVYWTQTGHKKLLGSQTRLNVCYTPNGGRD